MDHVSNPTPRICAENLKEALIDADLYDERNPSTSIACLLSDIMHLVDEEDCDTFTTLCKRARIFYKGAL